MSSIADSLPPLRDAGISVWPGIHQLLHGADTVATNPHVLRIRRATTCMPGVGGIIHVDMIFTLPAAEVAPVAVGVQTHLSHENPPACRVRGVYAFSSIAAAHTPPRQQPPADIKR